MSRQGAGPVAVGRIRFPVAVVWKIVVIFLFKGFPNICWEKDWWRTNLFHRTDHWTAGTCVPFAAFDFLFSRDDFWTIVEYSSYPVWWSSAGDTAYYWVLLCNVRGYEKTDEGPDGTTLPVSEFPSPDRWKYDCALRARLPRPLLRVGSSMRPCCAKAGNEG